MTPFDTDGRAAVTHSERLTLREFTLDDAPFMLALLTDPDWIRFIGDRGVRDVEGAKAYIEAKLIAQYRSLGIGLFLVERKTDGIPVGMCGLVQRPGIDGVDMGYAFLPAYRGAGYAREAARAVLALTDGPLGIRRVAAITSPDNEPSMRLLRDLGFRFVDQRRIGDATSVSSFFLREA